MLSCDSLSEGVGLIADAQNVAELEELLARLASELSYTGAAYYRLTRFGASVTPTLIFGAGFEAWVKVYIERNYVSADPVVPISFRRDLPFTAKEAETWAPQPAALHADRRKYWARDGLFCPVASSWGELGVLCWGCDQEVQLADRNRLAMGNLSLAFVTKFKTLSPEEVLPGLPLRPLSRREAECAYWIAEGNRANDVARILGLSIHTVRQYISSAADKLGARNRGEMILRASALGLIADHGVLGVKPSQYPRTGE